MKPGPKDFTEAQRARHSGYLVAAGIAVGIAAAVLVGILAYGGWPADRYEQIIDYLGAALIGAGAIMALVIAFLGLGGPVRSLKATIWKATIDTQGD